MNNLSSMELTILIEAVDAWIVKGGDGFIMGQLLHTIIGRDTPEAKEAAKREQEAASRKRDQEVQERQETGTLLKAKLIQMRRDVASQEFTTQAGQEANR